MHSPPGYRGSLKLDPRLSGSHHDTGIAASDTAHIDPRVAPLDRHHDEIEQRGDCVTVRFRYPDFVAPRPNGNDLIERQQAILAMLERSGEGLRLRASHARLPLQISERQVRRALDELQDCGQVVSTGPGPAARWKRVRGR